VPNVDHFGPLLDVMIDEFLDRLNSAPKNSVVEPRNPVAELGGDQAASIRTPVSETPP
jgi:hypothetical protein